jgi:hypothetical protein
MIGFSTNEKIRIGVIVGIPVALVALVLVSSIVAPRGAEVDLPLTPERVADCLRQLDAFAEAGVIKERRPGRLVVEEVLWQGLPWDVKLGTAGFAACAEGRERGYVEIYGYRSGARLAHGTPGLSFAPD